MADGEVAFNFKYNVNNPFEPHEFSVGEQGDIIWLLTIKSDLENTVFKIHAKPDPSVIRLGLIWKLTVDVEFTLHNEVHPIRRNIVFRNAYRSVFTETKENLSKYSEGFSFIVRILNIRREGIRIFRTINFERSNSQISDVTLSVNERKIYCSSQILSHNSTYFQKLIKEMKEPPYVIQLDLDSEVEFDEFLDFLHHLYYPSETTDEHNYRKLLLLGASFQAPQVLQICQNYMSDIMKKNTVFGCYPKIGNDTENMFMLAWKYNLEPLKYQIPLPINSSSGNMTRIYRNVLYKNMDEAQKIKMWEHLIQDNSL